MRVIAVDCFLDLRASYYLQNSSCRLSRSSGRDIGEDCFSKGRLVKRSPKLDYKQMGGRSNLAYFNERTLGTKL